MKPRTRDVLEHWCACPLVCLVSLLQRVVSVRDGAWESVDHLSGGVVVVVVVVCGCCFLTDLQHFQLPCTVFVRIGFGSCCFLLARRYPFGQSRAVRGPL